MTTTFTQFMRFRKTDADPSRGAAGLYQVAYTTCHGTRRLEPIGSLSSTLSTDDMMMSLSVLASSADSTSSTKSPNTYCTDEYDFVRLGLPVLKYSTFYQSFETAFLNVVLTAVFNGVELVFNGIDLY